MAKSYTEELAGWVSKHKTQRPRQDKNIVAFLAVKGDVKAALDAGYSMKTIWEHLHETKRIEYRYETFTLHVKRYIRAKPRAEHQVEQQLPQEQSKPQVLAAPTKPDQAQSEPRKTSLPSVGGFTFNATPKKEDLF
ncbi:TraK family protein [Azoarcus sp. PA01]|nr:TraK family protein [Azoarcus sp. PA01]KON82627.1 TraK family protein [Azoarcus sp. PA01]